MKPVIRTVSCLGCFPSQISKKISGNTTDFYCIDFDQLGGLHGIWKLKIENWERHISNVTYHTSLWPKALFRTIWKWTKIAFWHAIIIFEDKTKWTKHVISRQLLHVIWTHLKHFSGSRNKTLRSWSNDFVFFNWMFHQAGDETYGK